MTALAVGNIKFAPDYGRTTGLVGRDTQRTRLRPVIGRNRDLLKTGMGSEWLTSVPKFCWEKKQMKDSTDITIVLDRSGSMRSVQADTIGGFNTFLEEQRKIDKPATISLIQFDHEYETVYAGKDIKDAPELNADTFVPRGMTALLDAIGRTINSTGKRLAALSETERPQNVVVVVMTDGCENASLEFTSSKIADMIRHQQSIYKWQFVFIGANQDAILTAQRMGISRQHAMTYTADSAGVGSTFKSMTENIGSYRMTGSAADLDFTEAARKQAKGGTTRA